MSTLQAELRRIRKHLEATREELPVNCKLVLFAMKHDKPMMAEVKKRLRAEQEQLATDRQAKSWEEHKEGK